MVHVTPCILINLTKRRRGKESRHQRRSNSDAVPVVAARRPVAPCGRRLQLSRGDEDAVIIFPPKRKPQGPAIIYLLIVLFVCVFHFGVALIGRRGVDDAPIFQTPVHRTIMFYINLSPLVSTCFLPLLITLFTARFNIAVRLG